MRACLQRSRAHCYSLFLMVILARSAPILEEDFDVPAWNIGALAELLELARRGRPILFESLHEHSLGRVAYPDHLVLPLPSLLHLAGHEVELAPLARLHLGELEPLGETVGNGHGRLRPELESLEVAHEVVGESVAVICVGPETLGGLFLSETKCASARFELLDEVSNAIQVVGVGFVHEAELVLEHRMMLARTCAELLRLLLMTQAGQ